MMRYTVTPQSGQTWQVSMFGGPVGHQLDPRALDVATVYETLAGNFGPPSPESSWDPLKREGWDCSAKSEQLAVVRFQLGKLVIDHSYAKTEVEFILQSDCMTLLWLRQPAEGEA